MRAKVELGQGWEGEDAELGTMQDRKDKGGGMCL